MKFIISTFLLLVIAGCPNIPILAQTTSGVPQFNIYELKEHGMIFWLSDSKKRIAYLKSNGQLLEAEKEQAHLTKENQDLVQYFKAHFHFCKVNFYYTSMEEDLNNGLSVLLNDKMQPDPSIPLPEIRIKGGFYIKEDQEHNPFPQRKFWVENSEITMKLKRESWRPFWIKKPTLERDIIRLNRVLSRMASN